MRVKPLVTVLCFSALILLGTQFLTPMGGKVIALNVAIHITPKTLNVNMHARWINARIELPEGYNINDIDLSTIRLEGMFEIEWSNIECNVLMVKFNASSVTDYLLAELYHMSLDRASVELTVTGQLRDGTLLSGSDTITMMNPQS